MTCRRQPSTKRGRLSITSDKVRWGGGKLAEVNVARFWLSCMVNLFSSSVLIDHSPLVKRVQAELRN